MYLECEFRNLLFSQAYENAGESLRSLAYEVGYHGRKGRNGIIRDMWIGKVSVSGPKIEKIAELAGIPISDVLSHRIEKEKNVEIPDWLTAFKSYKKRKVTA